MKTFLRPFYRSFTQKIWGFHGFSLCFLVVSTFFSGSFGLLFAGQAAEIHSRVLSALAERARADPMGKAPGCLKFRLSAGVLGSF